MLARLTRDGERALKEPLYPPSSLRVWIAREATLSGFDPVSLFVGELADVDIHDRLPARDELAKTDRVLVLTRRSQSRRFAADDIAAAFRSKPGLWLVGDSDRSNPLAKPWPARAGELAGFIGSPTAA